MHRRNKLWGFHQEESSIRRSPLIAARHGSLSLFLWLLLLLAPAAYGQGTSGTLPDPISTAELNGYAKRLNLSDQQRHATHVLHDQYKEEFRALRQGEIAGFLKEMRSLERTMTIPQRNVVENIMKKMEQLNGRIAVLDNRLFDQLQTILTEDQMTRLHRVRLARQRARYTGTEMMWMTGRVVDLSEIFMTLELPPEPFIAADSIMAQYEARLTTAMGKLHEATMGMFLGMMDALEEMGFAEANVEDMETMTKLGEAMQQIWRDITHKTMEAAANLHELNQRTSRSVVAVLPPEQGREFRTRFYSRAYADAGLIFDQQDRLFRAALRLEDLGDEQRAELTAARDEALLKFDRIVDEAIALLNQSREELSPFDYDMEKMQERQQALQKCRERAVELHAASVERLKTLLGEERAQQVVKGAGDAGDGSNPAALAAARAKAARAALEGAQAEDSDDGEPPIQGWHDQIVAPPISRAEMHEYANILKLSDEQRSTLRQIHSAYRDQVKAIQENEVKAYTTVRQSMWRHDAGSASMALENVVQTDRARRAAIDALRRIDEQFFNDAQVAVVNDDQEPLLERVRLARERAVCNRGHHVAWSFSGSHEPRIDLVEFVRAQRLSAAELDLIDTLLREYELAASLLFRARYEAILDVSHAQERWHARSLMSEAEGGNPMQMAATYQEIMGAATKALEERQQEIATLNRETIARLLQALPPQTAHTMRLAYNKRAFPNVYNDQLALEERILAAMNLENLNGETRRRLEELAAAYRPAYADFCERLVAMSSFSRSPGFGGEYDAEQWREWQERQEAMASIMFDRSELNLRTKDQLRLLLSEDQVRIIGGLPEAPKELSYEVDGF